MSPNSIQSSADGRKSDRNGTEQRSGYSGPVRFVHVEIPNSNSILPEACKTNSRDGQAGTGPSNPGRPMTRLLAESLGKGSNNNASHFVEPTVTNSDSLLPVASTTNSRNGQAGTGPSNPGRPMTRLLAANLEKGSNNASQKEEATRKNYVTPFLPELEDAQIEPEEPSERKGPIRPKQPVEWRNGQLFGLVDDKFKPAGYHKDFRRQLILRDEQQRPGAPVWGPQMGLDYTSYSPLVDSWSEDQLETIRDECDNELCFMEDRPDHLRSKPNFPWLKCEGLVMLDDDNYPIMDFPGAPLTLKRQTEGYILLGLKRVLGMTFYDLRARMILKRFYKSSGTTKTTTYNASRNRVDIWTKKWNAESKRQGLGKTISVWAERGPKEEQRRKKGADKAPAHPRAITTPKNANQSLGINTGASPSGFEHQNIYDTRNLPESSGSRPFRPILPRSNVPSMVPAGPWNPSAMTVNPRGMIPPTNTSNVGDPSTSEHFYGNQPQSIYPSAAAPSLQAPYFGRQSQISRYNSVNIIDHIGDEDLQPGLFQDDDPFDDEFLLASTPEELDFSQFIDPRLLEDSPMPDP